MLKMIDKIGNKYANYIVGMILAIWLSLFLIPNKYLGANYVIRNTILLDIFPILGGMFLILSFLCKNRKFLFLGLSLVFAFYISMMIGYLILGG